MPQGAGRLDNTKHLFIRRLQRIEPPFTSTAEEGSLRLLFLDGKMIWMKFKVNIVVTC
jgi:hypothetical protein